MPFEIFVSTLLSYIPRLIFHILLALTKFGGFIVIVINDRKITGLLTLYRDSSSEAQLFWQSRARKIAEGIWTYHRGSPEQPNQCLKKVISTHKDTGGCQGLMENISNKKITTIFPQTTEGRTNVLKKFSLRKHCLDLKTECFEYDREFKRAEISLPRFAHSCWNGCETR